MQTLVVAVIVIACFAYAAQALMPTALRRWLARRLSTWSHWPAPLAHRLQRAARAPTTGCACEGCDRSAPGAKAAASSVALGPDAPQPIHILRRRS